MQDLYGAAGYFSEVKGSLKRKRSCVPFLIYTWDYGSLSTGYVFNIRRFLARGELDIILADQYFCTYYPSVSLVLQPPTFTFVNLLKFDL